MLVLIWKVLPVTLEDEKGSHVTANTKRSHLCEIDWKQIHRVCVVCEDIHQNASSGFLFR